MVFCVLHTILISQVSSLIKMTCQKHVRLLRNLFNAYPLSKKIYNRTFMSSAYTKSALFSHLLFYTRAAKTLANAIDFRLSGPGGTRHLVHDVNTALKYKQIQRLTWLAWRTSKNMVKTLIKSTARDIFAAAMRPDTTGG